MSRTAKHDLIVGGAITLGVLLGYVFSSAWFLLSGLIGVALIQSAFTGFCPVYYAMDQLEKKEGA